MEPTLTILLPTTNRLSLSRTLESIVEQEFKPGDELLVVSDGVYPGCRELWAGFNIPGRFIEHAAGPSGDWGHTPRNLYMKSCRTTHIMHMDDDDAYVPNALNIVREKVAQFPESLHFFSLGMGKNERYFWFTPDKPELGNVDTKMVVHRANGNWGVWGPGHVGDSEFIRETAALYNQDTKWWTEVIAVMRPSTLEDCGF